MADRGLVFDGDHLVEIGGFADPSRLETEVLYWLVVRICKSGGVLL